ncbi:ComEC/Rec2 family competence protein, partial [Paenibacillus sp. FSL M7-0831]
SGDREEAGKVIVTGSIENGTAEHQAAGIVATGYDANNKPIETKTISRLVSSGYSDSFSVELDAGPQISRVEVKETGRATDVELLSSAYRTIDNTVVATAVVENGTNSSKTVTVTFTGYDVKGNTVEVKEDKSSISKGYTGEFNASFSSAAQIKRIGIKISPDSSQLKVHFLDVGQADAILVKNNTGTIVVDSGGQSTSSEVVGYLNQQGVSKIDYLILTHPHEDHIGGAIDIINNFEVNNIIMPYVPSVTTAVYKNLISEIALKNINLVTPIPGMSCSIGQVTCTIVAPNGQEYSKFNDYSIVTKIAYNNTSFLLTGDAGSTSEAEMLSEGFDLTSDILKVGHHGSKTSTSDEFLEAVQPQYAIITCSDNSTTLPSQEVIDKLNSDNIQIYRTDESGTIVVTSDGQSIRFSTQY